jgi:hypothetical protein
MVEKIELDLQLTPQEYAENLKKTSDCYSALWFRLVRKNAMPDW